MQLLNPNIVKTCCALRINLLDYVESSCRELPLSIYQTQPFHL